MYSYEIKTLALQVDEMPDNEFYHFFSKLAEDRGFNLNESRGRADFMTWLKQVFDEIAPINEEDD